MDEWTFQHELYKLKERVANMAVKHSPRSPQLSLLATSDGFTTQMLDLKQHIARLEQCFGVPLQPPPLSTAASVQQPGQPIAQMESRCYLPCSDSHRADIECVSNRCLNIERAVSELEDRVESLDPLRFTPPGSDASADESFNYTGATASVRLPSVMTVPETTGRHSSKQMAESLLQTKLDASIISLDILRKYSSKMDGVQPLKKTENDVVRAIVKLHTKLASDHSWNAARLQDDTETHELNETSRRTSVASELDAGETLQPSHGEGLPVNQTGVAFRDQEILRLEELLSDAQEAATASEQQAAQDRQAFNDLQERYENSLKENTYHYDMYLQRDAELRALKEETLQRDVHLQQLNDYLHTRDEQRERYLENHRQVVEHSKEKSAHIHTAEGRIAELQKVLGTKDRDIEQMVQGRDEEVGRLQQFCEQKDAISHSQEQIIARGARLIEQREEEIEQLTRKIKTLGADNASERKQRQLTSKLLEDRDSELLVFKARSAAAEALDRPRVPDKIEEEQVSAFFAKRPPVWSPRPIPNDRRLHHEAYQASAWDGAENQRPEFGKPSPLGYRQSRRHRSSPHPRQIRYLIDGKVVDTDGNDIARPRSPPAPPAFEPLQSPVGARGPAMAQERPAARHSLPMDRTVWPPLPVVAPSHMQSLADLRSTARSEQLQRVVRHQSMQELKRRKAHYQAYVETEAEGGGERERERELPEI
ncbi:hypothetical protein LTR10_006933 [Elasticomyces elasticus]|nr:hypothetical protein LTR10_006933 [Elasticomyces elasticus]KAK4972669.1 hypothetical protein LTR42_005962 [Elasticomyces elasticus]